MDDYQKIMERMAALQYKINSNDKKPKSFGTSELLHPSEIHFIDAIGIDREVNASQLSNKLHISNGAITQVADKLLKKKLIEKYKIETNKKEVFFRLTEQGKVAYENHKEFHQGLCKNIIAYLNDLNPDQIEGILGFIAVSDESLPDLS
ncbi:MarR family transcriptional regulator [Acetobacterium carbinolicum]|uniref:MarR family transcriptional regulator n=1 Tax=Acetobacterium carbinolicum TaxID=52690 RepID=UPI0039C9C2E8